MGDFSSTRYSLYRAQIFTTLLFAEQCKLAMNQPWVFRWLSTRQCIRPLRNIDFFFLYTLPPRIRWHNGECTVGRLSEYRRKMYNCLKFKCRWCCDRPDQPVLMYRVSSCHRVGYIIGRIMDSYIYVRICALTQHTRTRCCWIRNAVNYRDIREVHERSRTVEAAYICECLSMQPRSELFIFKTIFK